MKKWLCKYLIVQMVAFSLPTSYTDSLLAIGNLVDHYFEHAKHDHDHSFVKFIQDHYAESFHHQHDHDGHQKLPFHNQSDGSVGIPMQTLTLAPEARMDRSVQAVLISSCGFTTPSPILLSAYLDNIWQPPRA